MAYAKKEDAYKYNNKFISEAYDRINLTVPKGEKERIQAAAKVTGESVNALIWRLLKVELERIEKSEDSISLEHLLDIKGRDE